MLYRFSIAELAITEIELSAMAAAAIIGLSNPIAANGIAPELYAKAQTGFVLSFS